MPCEQRCLPLCAAGRLCDVRDGGEREDEGEGAKGREGEIAGAEEHRGLAAGVVVVYGWVLGGSGRARGGLCRSNIRSRHNDIKSKNSPPGIRVAGVLGAESGFALIQHTKIM